MERFEYLAPETVREAVVILEAHPDAAVLAGGTDLLMRMKARARMPKVVVDIKRISGLDAIRFDAKGGLSIGAAVTMRQAERSAAVCERYPALAQGVGVVGSVQIRNRATLAGNLCNAAPSADTAPGLIALGARVRIAGPGGTRALLVENFMTGPGRTVLKPGEFVTGIRVPAVGPDSGSAYARHTPREAMDLAVVGVGAAVTVDARTGVCREVRIALGAVAPAPLRAREAERILQGRKPTAALLKAAAEAAAGACRPISDVRASADYRREMVRVLTFRVVERTLEAARRRRAERRVA